MNEKLNKLKNNFMNEFQNVRTVSEWNDLRLKYIGKKGLITGELKNLKNSDNKKEDGQLINNLKNEIQEKLSEKKEEIDQNERETKLKDSKIDITLPPRSKRLSKQNILLKTQREIETIFLNLGFEVALGSEVETDYYNFEALNLDKFHPARDMQDTFYINPKVLLRTHTSNIQTRLLSENQNQEFKIICPGKVYRRDDDDATHSHQFTQIEGLVVARKNSKNSASLKDLKTLLTVFAQKIFNDDKVKTRLRSSYFPFTEPSVEVDVTCSNCHGKGCSFCKQTGWIEILGAGIINPEVLRLAGFSERDFTGYAIGMGVERITLLKYNIEDIRNFYTNSNEFINQFN